MDNIKDYWHQALIRYLLRVACFPSIASISRSKTPKRIFDPRSKTTHGRRGDKGAALKRGDIVFWSMKELCALRRAVVLGQWGDCKTHVSIACGDGDKVFEATPFPQRASGNRTGIVIGELDPDIATYYVFRHTNPEAAALLANVAEGYVALHKQLGDKFGRFSYRKIIETFIRGAHEGQKSQWGEVRSSIPADPWFYCSSYVIRVLLAAHQTMSETKFPSELEQAIKDEVSIIDATMKLPVYSSPAQLYRLLSVDGNWDLVHENAVYEGLCSKAAG